MRRALLGTLALTLGLGLGACTEDEGEETDAVRPAGVGITARDTSEEPIAIGVVVSLGAAPGEGGPWAAAAAGTQVAAYQYDVAGQQVDLRVVDDQGTAEGFARALDDLAAQDVSGVVAATSGPHLVQALTDAAPEVPVLLPYEGALADPPAGVWLTGPSTEQWGSAAADLVQRLGATTPYVVTVDDQRPPALADAPGEVVGAAADPAAVADSVRQAVGGDAAPDAVVLDVPGALAAGVVAAVQGQDLEVPVVLGREALAPGFGTAVQDAGGSLVGDLGAVGVESADTAVNTSGDAGERAATFFSALRLAAGDPDLAGLFGEGTFAESAGSADAASHDAVVALVSAAQQAGSTDPAEVGAALGQLTLTAADGLTGPDLAFAQPDALAEESVVGLQATSQDPGARPAGVGAPMGLFWFALPAAQ